MIGSGIGNVFVCLVLTKHGNALAASVLSASPAHSELSSPRGGAQMRSLLCIYPLTCWSSQASPSSRQRPMSDRLLRSVFRLHCLFCCGPVLRQVFFISPAFASATNINQRHRVHTHFTGFTSCSRTFHWSVRSHPLTYAHIIITTAHYTGATRTPQLVSLLVRFP